MIQAGTVYSTWRDLNADDLRDALRPVVNEVAVTQWSLSVLTDELGSPLQDENNNFLEADA